MGSTPPGIVAGLRRPDAAVARMRDAVPRRPLTRSDQDRIVALLERVQPHEMVRETGTNGDTITRY